MMAEFPQRATELAEADKGGCKEDKPCKLHGARAQEAQEQMMAELPQPAETQSLAGAEVHATRDGVEVDAPSLKDSIRDARAMGFKGVPREVVYKPAGGRAVTYMLAQE